MTNGKMPSMMNSQRQSEKVRIQPDSGAVMMEAMAMFIIQKRVGAGPFGGGEPVADQDKDRRPDAGLGDAEEEAHHEQLGEALDESGKDGQHAPDERP